MAIEKKAYIIQTDGEIIQLPDRPTLAEAQKIVGGYIEFATGRVDNHNVEIVCNEEGLLEGLAKNYKATIYPSTLTPSVMITYGYVQLKIMMVLSKL